MLLPLVFDAFRAMRAANPEARLILVGAGPMADELKRTGLGVVINGRLDDGELSAHYATADISCSPAPRKPSATSP